MDPAGDSPPPPKYGASSSPSISAKCYSSPRRLLSRLFSALSLNKEKHRKIQNHVTDSTNIGTDHSSSPSRQLHRNDTSFKVGVGCGLLYLMAASKSELGKMVELRKEMEMLLQNLKGELQSKNVFPKPLKPGVALACSITDIQEVSCSDSSHPSIHSQTPYAGPDPKCIMVHDGFLEYNKTKQDECADEINELQAEFEFELERLQLYFEGEAAFGDAQQERVEVGFVEDSSSESHSSDFGEIIMDPLEASDDLSFGINPVELERRLHELLEARLRERISELESALECTTQKLIEKEMEVTWWKDTAQLFSQHVPETTRFTFRLDPEAALKLSEVVE
ncbi:hypothetical protein RIF29_12434 [Crotalaria pallida]|uniref:Uncharacterized protein n=1 Tax=Crotalaria pallida TaxID=3830 RepID=A0AAN9P0Y6_CROPI